MKAPISCTILTVIIFKKRIKMPAIPQFTLYGEQAPIGGAEFVHIELIETRSRLHCWRIGSHTHRGLFQVLFLFGGQIGVCQPVPQAGPRRRSRRS